MRFYVGTSGWSYRWNKGRNLRWYIENTPFNAVELNASFYRFPYKSYIKSWRSFAEKGLKFSVKVHRFITHVHRFNENAIEAWQKFRELFIELEPYIAFYLFQLPPSLKPDIKHRVIEFFQQTGILEKIAVEFRNIDWFEEEHISPFRNAKIMVVSVSAPRLPDAIFNTAERVYLRFHGKTQWYRYVYSEEELENYHKKVIKSGAKEAYFFFNNDTGMYENALYFAGLCGLK